MDLNETRDWPPSDLGKWHFLGQGFTAFLAMASLLAVFLVACGTSRPTTSTGGADIRCPDGSANPGMTIRTVNCQTVVQFEGQDLVASMNSKALGEAGIKNVSKVLREVSEAANDAQIQFTQTCELYNGCNLTSGEYRDRLDKAQDHFRRIREKVSLLEAAKGNPEVLRQTVADLYIETVPPKRVAETTLGLEFYLQARSGNQSAHLVREGETLHSGDQVVFRVRTTQDAYVYIFQKKKSGAMDVLFPNALMNTVTNPVPASTAIRLPPRGMVFTLNNEDIGEETVFIAASKEPLADLQSALGDLASGDISGKSKVNEAIIDLLDEGAPECAGKTRSLEVTPESTCGSMTRGFTPTMAADSEKFFGDDFSLQARTAPGDNVMIRSFRFIHEP